MINKTKIKFNEVVYYVPQYSGSPRKVSIIKLIELNGGDGALVKPYSKKQELKVFPIPLEHIFNSDEAARRGGRDWEHYMRHRKKQSIKKNLKKKMK